MLLVDDLLLLPAKGFMGVVRRIGELAEEEHFSKEKLKEGLLNAQTLLDTDQITEKEYNRRERDILKRLDEIKKHE
jgi:hypothetical protein